VSIFDDINASLGQSGVNKPLSQQPAGRPITILDEIDAALEKKFDKPGKRFRVTNVIDGDTLDLEGFGRVRLAGLDTPETVHPTKKVQSGGPEASAFLKKLGTGKNVTVSLQAGDTQDKYGRHLAALTDDDGNIFNAEVIKGGHSKQTKEIPSSASVTTPETGRLWRSSVAAMQNGISRGFFYPVSSFFSNDWKLMQRAGDRARRDLLQELDSRGSIDGHVRDKVVLAPEIVGELIGGLPINVATYGAFRGATGVATAATMTGKVARSTVAAGASAASISAFAHLDNGESRFARMARDAAIGGAFEIIGIPLMRKAWREEIGQKVADEAVGKIAAETGFSAETVATHIDRLRSGNVGSDIAIAQALSRELAKNDTAANTILKLNADRAAGDWYADVLATKLEIDPLFFTQDANFGVHGRLELKNPVNGETQYLPFHVKSNPADRPAQPGQVSQTKFAVETRQLRDTALEFRRRGFEVKLDEARVGGIGAWTRFNNIFRGADGDLPLKSAPEGTLAARAERPVAGKRYRDAVSGKNVEVLGSEQPWDDFDSYPEARAVLRSAPGDEISSAVALARTSHEEDIATAGVKEINRRVVHYQKNLDQIEQQSDGGLLALDKMLVEADKSVNGYAAVRARVTNEMETRNLKRVRPDPKGVQPPIESIDEEGIEAQARGARTNDWGVAGYQRREGSNQLVDLMRQVKTSRGKSRQIRQGVRDQARRVRSTWNDLRNEDHARIASTADVLAEEDQLLAKQVSEREALPIPAGMPGFEANKWTVKVRDDRGVVSTQSLDKLFPLAEIQSPGYVARPLGLRPHSNGETRHGIVDLQSRKVITEDFDRPSEYWRSPEATAIDEEDYLVGHMPRVFMHGQGITLSIPNTANFDSMTGEWRSGIRYPKIGGAVEDVGPRDTIQGLQRGRGDYNPNLPRVKGNQHPTDPGERNVIRQSATPVRFFDPDRQQWKTKPRSEADFWEVFAGKPDTSVTRRHMPAGYVPRKAAKPGHAGEYSEDSIPRVLEQRATEFGEESIRPASFALTKDGAEKSLEMVTARRAAQVLLTQGADPTTPVRITVSGAQFDAVDGSFEWTLDELSKLKFGDASYDSLTQAARERGFRIAPDAEGYIVGGQGGQYRFPTGQEALEFLLRVPRGKKYGPVIEKKLLQAWAVDGPERSTDAVVDGVRFRETSLQESSITEVVGGGSAATIVQSKHGRMLNGTVQALAKKANVGGSFNAMPIDGVFSDKAHDLKQFVVYEKGAVRARINAHQETLRKMGIDPSQGEEAVMSQLNQFGHGTGLHFLFGNRNPSDALLYAQLRQWNQPELFRRGSLQYDSHGPFRTYTETNRKEIIAALSENPPNPIYDPALEKRLAKAGIGGPVGAPRGIRDVLASAPDEGGSGPRTPFDSLAPIGAGGGDLRPPVVELTGAAEEEYLSSSRTFRMTDFFRVPMELFKEYQQATGIPFYRWWQSIDHGRTQVIRATHPLFNQVHAMARLLPRDERIQVGKLFELRYLDNAAYQRVQGQAPDTVKKAEGLLDSVLRKFITDLDMDPEKELKELPHFRRMNMDSVELRPYDSTRPPNPITRKSRSFGENLGLDEREYDFAVTMKRYGRALAHEKYLAQEWTDIDKSLTQLAGVESDHGVKVMIDFFNRHRAEAVHAQDRLGYGMAMGIRNITKRVLGVELAHDEAVDVVGTLTGANYFANMAFNMGMTARNYLQTLQTVFPVMGGTDTAFGIRMGLRWRKDPNIRAAMEKRDIVNTNAMLEPLSNIQQALLESPRLAGYAEGAGKVVDFMNKGVQFYQSADDFNRVVAYYSQFNAAERAGKQFLDRKISWAEYLVESKAEFRDVDAGELIVQVKQALGSGNNELASHLLALDFAKASQFLYSRGNVPYVMQSTAGRLFGQYGTWPAWYTEWFGNHMLRRGSTKSRVQFAARWAGVNAAFFYGMSEVFGVDFGRWSFFAPLVYTGGPLAQVGMQAGSALSAAASGDEDAVSRIQAARLRTSAWKQFLPFPTVASSHALKSAEAFGQGDYGESLKMLFGLPDVRP